MPSKPLEFNFLSAVLTAIAGAAIAAAVHEHALAQTAQQKAAEMALVSSRPQPSPMARPNPPPPPAHAPGAAAANSEQSQTRGEKHITPFGMLLRTLSDPRFQKVTSIQARIRLDAQYGPLFKSLNLSPQQLDQFKGLLIEKQLAAFDSMSAAQEQGIDFQSDPRGFYTAVADSQKTVEGQISDLLGAANYGQFQQYEQTIPARNTVNLLQQGLAYTSTPLTTEQSAALIPVLTQYAKPAMPSSNPFAVLNGDLGVVHLGDQGVSQLQGVLSAPQVQALNTEIAQQEALYQARRRTAH